MLLDETPFIPVYTYVTKRMVNPRLKGWENNVMDHHYSKDMFFLKAATDEPEVMESEEPVSAGGSAPVLGAGPETTVDESAMPVPDPGSLQENIGQDLGGVLR